MEVIFESPRAATAVTPVRETDLASLASAWKQNTSPFHHVVWPEIFKRDVAEIAYRDLLNYSRIQQKSFVKYEKRWEKLKFTQNKLELMPPSIAEIIRYLNSATFITKLEKVTGLQGLVADDGLWGGGIHCTTRGGKLDIHNDFTILPTTYGQPKEWHRVLNLIVYLNASWTADWGGELELWNSEMTTCESRLSPRFNQGVLFHTHGSNHGQPDPYNGPEDQPRLSLATYYYQLVQPGSVAHRSTLYQIRPGETETEKERQDRLDRADPSRYSKMLNPKANN